MKNIYNFMIWHHPIKIYPIWKEGGGEVGPKSLKIFTDPGQLIDFLDPLDGALIKHTKPFFHPAIISTLQQVFAKNVAEKYSERFTSSISTGPRHDEKEMPVAITAFITTCVRFLFWHHVVFSHLPSSIMPHSMQGGTGIKKKDPGSIFLVRPFQVN
jgi:hypothetical protein